MNFAQFKRILLTLIDVAFHLLPTNKNWIMFTSFWGQYNDNPKYISEELHKKNISIKIFWGVSEKRSCEIIPSYIKKCKYNSLLYYWYKNRCSVIVDNIVGDYSMYGKDIALSLRRFVKNRKQFNLSTWHGNPIKKIGRDLYGERFLGKNDFFSTSDMLICGCTYVKNIFSRCFNGVPEIRITGTPRCDTMFSVCSETVVGEIKEKLKLPKDKKILLYAPTYRNNPLDSGINQINSLNIKNLLDELSLRFGGDWIIVFRVHNSVLAVLSKHEIFNLGIVYNGNLGDDMMEYMQVADAMITDYSGAIFDYVHTYRPCFLYALDKKHYINEERGVYIDLDILPYKFSESPNDLLKSIHDYNEKEQQGRIIKFNEYIGNQEKGNASSNVVNIILEHMS